MNGSLPFLFFFRHLQAAGRTKTVTDTSIPLDAREAREGALVVRLVEAVPFSHPARYGGCAQIKKCDMFCRFEIRDTIVIFSVVIRRREGSSSVPFRLGAGTPWYLQPFRYLRQHSERITDDEAGHWTL